MVRKNNLLIIFGLTLISIFVLWRYHQERILSFNSKEITKSNYSGITPIHIKSYPVGIDVNVKPAVITNGVWPVFPDTAGFVANDNNLIIYGHNKNNILGPLRWIKLGAIIEILGTDNKNYKYEVIKTDTVSPDNLEYIKSTEIDTLTIYTCTSFIDSKRFIVIAKRLN